MSDQLAIPVRVKRAQRLFVNSGVPQGFYMCVDANGHVMQMGQCFKAAEKLNAYPVTVYELQTNWADADAVVAEGGAA